MFVPQSFEDDSVSFPHAWPDLYLFRLCDAAGCFPVLVEDLFLVGDFLLASVELFEEGAFDFDDEIGELVDVGFGVQGAEDALGFLVGFFLEERAIGVLGPEEVLEDFFRVAGEFVASFEGVVFEDALFEFGFAVFVVDVAEGGWVSGKGTVGEDFVGLGDGAEVAVGDVGVGRGEGGVVLEGEAAEGVGDLFGSGGGREGEGGVVGEVVHGGG